MKKHSEYPPLPWEDAPVIVMSTNETETFDKKLASAAQEKYCKEKDLPHFASKDGVCWKCNGQIYDKISVEKAGRELITGCPLCTKSYCD